MNKKVLSAITLLTFMASAQPLWAAPMSAQTLKDKLQKLHQQQLVTTAKIASHQKTLQTNLGKVKKQRQTIKQQRLTVKQKAKQQTTAKVAPKVVKKVTKVQKKVVKKN